MLFFRLMEWAFAAALLLVFVTQIAWPVIKGRPLFPLFRNQRKLEKSLAEANQAKLEADLEKKVKKVTPPQHNGNQ